MGQGRDDRAHVKLKEYPIEGSTPLEAGPGDVVFFNYCLLHGSMPNTSDKTRKTVLTQMYSGQDSLEQTNFPHLNENIALRGWNHIITRESAGTQN